MRSFTRLIGTALGLGGIWLIFRAGKRLNARDARTVRLNADISLHSESIQPPSEPELRQLRLAYGHRKQLPPQFEAAALLALSHYPELRSVPIRFVVRTALLPLASRPAIRHMFGPKSQWQYDIIISRKSWLPGLNAALLHRIPFDAQVGILGHELAHTASYIHKTGWEMLIIGVNYVLSPAFRTSFERSTDRRTLAHGLGWPLYRHARYLEQHLKDVYLTQFENNYLSSQAILDEMQRQYPASVNAAGK